MADGRFKKLGIDKQDRINVNPQFDKLSPRERKEAIELAQRRTKQRAAPKTERKASPKANEDPGKVEQALRNIGSELSGRPEDTVNLKLTRRPPRGL